jgi:hypothetical protein
LAITLMLAVVNGGHVWHSGHVWLAIKAAMSSSVGAIGCDSGVYVWL